MAALGRLGRLLRPGRSTGARPEVRPEIRARAGFKTGVVRAGGGVVWRLRPDGSPEVILVHRPKYDDWSLPKGKLHAGEDEATAALREVEEETGLRCVLGPELPVSRYRDRFDREKTVRYWAMTPEPGNAGAPAFVPNREVDEVRWLAPDDAASLLSYDRDREILGAFRGEAGRDRPAAATDTP